MASSTGFKIISILCVQEYIARNFYKQIKGNTSYNTVIDHGIVKLIHAYCLLPDIDASALSYYTFAEYYASTKRSLKTMRKPVNEAPNPNVIENMKIVVLGEGCIGKTCLLIRYVNGTFPGAYIPTVMDNYCKPDVFDGQKITVGLWDTAGGCDYPRLRPLSYPQTDIFLICVSIYDKKTFELDKDKIFSDSQVNTMAFCQEIWELCPNIPYVFIGTKSDLRRDLKCKDDCYSKEEMEMFATHCKALGYAECSALEDENVKEIFEFTVKRSLGFKRRLQESKKQKTCIVM
eukprot:155729_1